MSFRFLENDAIEISVHGHLERGVYVQYLIVRRDQVLGLVDNSARNGDRSKIYGSSHCDTQMIVNGIGVVDVGRSEDYDALLNWYLKK